MARHARCIPQCQLYGLLVESDFRDIVVKDGYRRPGQSSSGVRAQHTYSVAADGSVNTSGKQLYGYARIPWETRRARRSIVTTSCRMRLAPISFRRVRAKRLSRAPSPTMTSFLRIYARRVVSKLSHERGRARWGTDRLLGCHSRWVGEETISRKIGKKEERRWKPRRNGRPGRWVQEQRASSRSRIEMFFSATTSDLHRHTASCLLRNMASSHLGQPSTPPHRRRRPRPSAQLSSPLTDTFSRLSGSASKLLAVRPPPRPRA